MPVGGGVVEAARGPGELGGEHEPDAHRGAVAPPVVLAALDGVAERVAVVEDLPQVGLAQVRRHHLGLHPDRAPHQLRQHRARRVERRDRIGLDEVEDGRVGDEARP